MRTLCRSGSTLRGACRPQNYYCTKNRSRMYDAEIYRADLLPPDLTILINGQGMQTVNESYRQVVLAAFLSISIAFALVQAGAEPEEPEVILIDENAPSHPFPHFWEKMFGSGRAILTLRESYRRGLPDLKQIPASNTFASMPSSTMRSASTTKMRTGSQSITSPTWIKSTTAFWPMACAPSSRSASCRRNLLPMIPCTLSGISRTSPHRRSTPNGTT